MAYQGAYRPKGFGLSAELAKKKEKKFDAELASDCFQWMKYILDDGGLYDEANTLNTEVRWKSFFFNIHSLSSSP